VARSRLDQPPADRDLRQLGAQLLGRVLADPGELKIPGEKTTTATALASASAAALSAKMVQKRRRYGCRTIAAPGAAW
jgi:hypothetical protein